MKYHLAGDSTVAPMKRLESPMCGWGHELGPLVEAPVRNLAFGGATTETFLQTGAWGQLLSEVAPDDVVLIQFGHNDQKEPGLLGAREGFSSRLRLMVRQAREASATVILCTPCERRWFVDDVVTPTHGDYPNAVRDLARDLGIPLIDLTAFTSWLYEDAGPDQSKLMLSHFAPGESLAWPDGLEDDTHFRVRGARRLAAFVARSLRAIERKDGGHAPRGSEFAG